MPERTKGQVSVEYMIVVGMAFLLLIIFLASFQDTFQTLMDSQEQRLVKDLAYMVQQEVMIASSVEMGYQRTFTLPENLDGFEYTVENSQKKIIIRSENFDFAVTIPQIRGMIQKGDNTIRRMNGLVCLGDVNCTDTQQPSILSSGPSGIVLSPVTLTATTDEESSCKYSEDDLDYYSMRDAMSGAMLDHEVALTLGNGSFTYRVRCTDLAGNAMNTSETISFDII